MHTVQPRLLPKLLGSLLVMTLAGFSACTAPERDYGSSNSSGSSSSGTTQTCSTDSECGANDECQSFTCEAGLCKVTFAESGKPIAMQAKGDCKTKVCNGKGYVISIGDLADPLNDGNPCTLDACVGTETQHGNIGKGTDCMNTYLCDGLGACVACLDNSHCPSGVCTVTHECATPECNDQVPNGSETDIDCGGPICPACPPGLICKGPTDCKSLVCIDGICAIPTCTDGVKNGNETDIDCGGPDCAPCNPTQLCNGGQDCTSQVCVASICQEPTCDDQVKNGNESDVDCGGGACLLCGVGQDCASSGDCKSLNCCFPDPEKVLGYCEKPGYPCIQVARPVISQ